MTEFRSFCEHGKKQLPQALSCGILFVVRFGGTDAPDRKEQVMKHTVSLQRAVAVGALAAVTCSLVTGMAVYGATHPSGELAEIYQAL